MANLFSNIPLNELALNQSREIREKAEDLWRAIESTQGSPERTLAQRKLEECVMWSIKSISRNQPTSV